MNILSVHNLYLHRGGEDVSTEYEIALLRESGHNVVEYRSDNHSLVGDSMFEVGIRSIWNQQAYRQIVNLVRERKIDLVKIDNFFPQISPAVYYAAHFAGVPSVQTLRNYRIGCPGALLYRNGSICEKCVGKNFAWPGILHGCYRGSHIVTAAPALMSALHRVAGTWQHRVTAYVALTDFSRDKFVEIGLPAEKIFVKPNFAPDTGTRPGAGGYALYVGRLSQGKGVDTLIEAWKLLGNPIKLKIVGSGPLHGEFATATATSSVELLGEQPLARVYELAGDASMVIFPSTWFETFGRIVAESFALGTPVIAARLGSMPAMIDHQKSGLLFEPGDSQSLAAQVRWMLDHKERWPAMRAAARAAYEQNYTPARNYQRMMEIYSWAISKQSAKAGRSAHAI